MKEQEIIEMQRLIDEGVVPRYASCSARKQPIRALSCVVAARFLSWFQRWSKFFKTVMWATPWLVVSKDKVCTAFTVFQR